MVISLALITLYAYKSVIFLIYSYFNLCKNVLLLFSCFGSMSFSLKTKWSIFFSLPKQHKKKKKKLKKKKDFYFVNTEVMCNSPSGCQHWKHHKQYFRLCFFINSEFYKKLIIPHYHFALHYECVVLAAVILGKQSEWKPWHFTLKHRASAHSWKPLP